INILKIGYDTEYARYSPGVLLKKKILEAVSGNGVHKLDLQGYCEPWKMRWTSRSREFTPIWVCRKAAYPLIVYYLLFGVEIFLKRCASRVKAKRKHVHDRKDSRI
ncbi:MAG: GNAT family N-acetyltransferase, partial [Candidatus Omnitrophota bacterium]